MAVYRNAPTPDELYHYGVKGMKWGKRHAVRYGPQTTDKGWEYDHAMRNAGSRTGMNEVRENITWGQADRKYWSSRGTVAGKRGRDAANGTFYGRNYRQEIDRQNDAVYKSLTNEGKRTNNRLGVQERNAYNKKKKKNVAEQAAKRKRGDRVKVNKMRNPNAKAKRNDRI